MYLCYLNAIFISDWPAHNFEAKLLKKYQVHPKTNLLSNFKIPIGCLVGSSAPAMRLFSTSNLI